MKRISRRAAFVLGVLLTLGAILRLSDLDLMEFKHDEVAVLRLAEAAVENLTLPTTGMQASIGIPNPPLFLYVLTPCLWVTASPLATAALIAAGSVISLILLAYLAREYTGRDGQVFALALAVASPWLVVYSRKIWSVDLSHLLMLLLFACLLKLAYHPVSRWVVMLPVLLALNLGWHFSGVPVCGAALLFFLVVMDINALRWRWLGAGLLLGLLLLAPYGVHLIRHGLTDASQALQATGRSGVAESLVASVERTGYVFFAGDIRELTGPAFADAHPYLQGLVDGLSWTGVALVWASALHLLVRVVRRARRDPAGPLAGMRRKPAQLLVLLFLLAPVAVYTLGRLVVHNHYFIVSMPAMFLSVGMMLKAAIKQANKQRGARFGFVVRIAVSLLIALYTATGLWWMLAFNRHLEKIGGTRGDYGEAYRYQAAAAEWITARCGEHTRMQFDTRMRDGGIGLQYLIQREVYGGKAGTEKIARTILVNTLLLPPPTPAPSVPVRQRIGPYEIRCSY